MKLTPAIAILALALMTVRHAEAAVADVRLDWSDINNPNGVWRYLVNGSLAISNVRGNDVFAAPGPPRIWGSGHLGWSQSNGSQSSYLDILTDDIYGHSGIISLTWTSPEAGFAQVDGGTWMLRDIGRNNHWDLLLNNVVEESGDIFSGDPFNRATPQTFSLSTPVQPGDVLEFRVQGDDYFGLNLTVSTIPEPSTSLIGLVGLFSVAIRRIRKV